jgi:hypothetical protein
MVVFAIIGAVATLFGVSACVHYFNDDESQLWEVGEREDGEIIH